MTIMVYGAKTKWGYKKIALYTKAYISRYQIQSEFFFEILRLLKDGYMYSNII